MSGDVVVGKIEFDRDSLYNPKCHVCGRENILGPVKGGEGCPSCVKTIDDQDGFMFVALFDTVRKRLQQIWGEKKNWSIDFRYLEDSPHSWFVDAKNLETDEILHGRAKIPIQKAPITMVKTSLCDALEALSLEIERYAEGRPR